MKTRSDEIKDLIKEVNSKIDFTFNYGYLMDLYKLIDRRVKLELELASIGE